MQLPETPPPPLAPLWDRVLRARALPPDLDVSLLYVAIRDRLTHPEWEVRLHALRVLADLLPLSGNALAFPFDQVVDNLGHNSPNVRKAALDALKVFCTHCEDVECAARAILDKCYYHNIRPHSAGVDTKMNVITGLILSIPSVMSILKRRNATLDIFPVFQILGEKLFDPIHRDVSHRAMMKLRKVCGSRDYMSNMSRLDKKIQEKFQVLCDNYDEDSHDVFYAPRKSIYRDNNNQPLVKINQVFNNSLATPLRVSTDSSSEDSFGRIVGPYYTNNFAKVIIETEIKFDSDTAITMTVLEEDDTDSERNTLSEDDYDSSDRNMLRYSDDGDSEDTDVVVKKVRFGGESVKIRTPDSDNLLTSEDDVNQNVVPIVKDNIEQVSRPVTPVIVNKMNEIKREAFEREVQTKPVKKSGIPLPVIHNKSHKQEYVAHYKRVKLKSKSLSELYDYFSSKNEVHDSPKSKEFSGFALTLSEVRSPENVPSPVEPHREVEVLHNLQRSPVVSPRRSQTRVHIEQDGFILNLLASSPPPREDLVSPRAPTPLRPHYDWEDLDIVPQHVVEQLHNTENWISAVKAADQLHSALLEADMVRKVEPAALSLVKHMWALSDAIIFHIDKHNNHSESVLNSTAYKLLSTVAASHLGRTVSSPSAAAEDAANKKRQKYAAIEVLYLFVPIAVGTMGLWGTETKKLFTKLGLSLTEKDDDSRSGSFLVQRMAIAIQRGNAASVVGTPLLRERSGVAAAKAPAEGAVCALVRGASSDCARQLLPALVSRMAREPLPAALPHALLQRLALHHLVDLIFDPFMIGVSGDSERVQSAQLRATMCLARAAGPAAVLSAVRRRLAGTSRADHFCNKLRERLRRPLENIRPSNGARSSQLPVPVRRRARSTPPPAGPQPPRRLRPLPDSAPLPSITQTGREYLLKPLSPILLSDRDSSVPAAEDEKNAKESPKHNGNVYNGEIPNRSHIFGDAVSADLSISESDLTPRPSRSPSIRVEDYSETSNRLVSAAETQASPVRSQAEGSEGPTSLKSNVSTASEAERRSPSGKSATPPAISRNTSPTRSAPHTPTPVDEPQAEKTPRGTRDVRTALAECIVPVRHEDWEAIVTGLTETERLATDPSARAPPASWRAAARSVTGHVRSLRSRVARAACRTLGALFEHRGRALDPELEEGAAALLDRCADVNRFLRADAGAALGRVACCGASARAVVALCRRGATHRAGPVRAAAVAALARLVRRDGATRALDAPAEARVLLLRAAGEALGDASAETRAHARHLCLALSEDVRFRPLLKEAMPISRYRAIEKLVDKLRCG